HSSHDPCKERPCKFERGYVCFGSLNERNVQPIREKLMNTRLCPQNKTNDRLKQIMKQSSDIIPGLTAISCSGTIFACLKLFRILISRNAVIGTPSFSLCIRMRFKASNSPV